MTTPVKPDQPGADRLRLWHRLTEDSKTPVALGVYLILETLLFAWLVHC